MPGGEGWPDGFDDGLYGEAAEVGLDAVPYRSDDCPDDDGEVGSSQAEGSRMKTQSSSK